MGGAHPLAAVGQEVHGNPADVDEVVTVPDAVVEEQPSAPERDEVTRYRSMSKKDLMAEAKSPAHLVSHHPHNPYCETCILAHLRQSRFHRSTPASDDQLQAITEPGRCLSADTIIITRASDPGDPRASVAGETIAFSVRDRFSGMGLVFPQTSRRMNSNYHALKFYQGPSGRYRPDIVVKSDCAAEITGAVTELGWHPEPSLENRFPHSSEHER